MKYFLIHPRDVERGFQNYFILKRYQNVDYYKRKLYKIMAF